LKSPGGNTAYRSDPVVAVVVVAFLLSALGLVAFKTSRCD
jgi:hypothetical protein